jgi:hypothetical protein
MGGVLICWDALAAEYEREHNAQKIMSGLEKYFCVVSLV